MTNVHFCANALRDADIRGCNRFDFFRIVCHEPDRRNFQEAQNLDGQAIVAKVSLVSKVQISLDGIESCILQFIGAELFHQADAPPFLILIEQYPRALFGDAAQSEMKLIVAVATKRVENISGGALRVDTDEGWSRVNVSKNQRECRFEVAAPSALRSALERQETKRSPASGKANFSDLSQRSQCVYASPV